MRVTMIGAGHVELVFAACFADFRHQVLASTRIPAAPTAL
jgi:UDP-glucose 6-dehydrogenase